jgi:hypothetical protein
VLKMSTPKRKRNLLDFRQKREIVEIKNPSIYWQMMSSSDLDFLNINEETYKFVYIYLFHKSMFNFIKIKLSSF